MKKLLLFAFLLTVFSCKDDDINELQNPTQETTEEVSAAPLDFGAPVQADFMGRIVNDEGFRINNATVTIGNQTVQTDTNGVFSIQEATVFENFALIKVTKDNYIQGSRALVPQEGGFNSIEITLLRKNIVETVNSGESSQVSYEGSNIFFPGEFEYPDGTPYNGQVDVSVHYLKPNVPQTFSAMPGMLLGEDANGNAQSMETYGMLAVNLFDQAGEELDIVEGFPATLEFPVDPDQAGIAPSEIPLWYFDEEMGYWKQEGTAQKQGDKYVGEVAHFTWWNCDLPLDYVTLCMNLTANEQAISGNYIELIRNETGQTIFFGSLDQNGSECGLIPANESITLNIYGSSLECINDIIYQEDIGPYSADTAIDVVIPPDIVDTTLISGTILNCDNTPLQEGFAIIFDGSNGFVAGPIPVANGELLYQFNHCSVLDFQIRIFDSNTTQVSEFMPMYVNENEIALGSVALCEEQSLIYEGDVVLHSQEEVDAFGLQGYIGIEGSLIINNTNPILIQSLSPLSSLEEISGGLSLHQLDELENFSGLDNLISIGGSLRITNAENLTSLEAFNNIDQLYGLWLHNLDSLSTLNGLNSLTDLEWIVIDLIPSLISLDALDNINSISLQVLRLRNLPNIDSIEVFDQVQNVSGDLSVSQLYNLPNLYGLHNIISVGELKIDDNWAINTLDGLNQLSVISSEAQITGNEELLSLDGLESLSSINNLIIGGENCCSNYQLTDFCALQNLFTNGTYIEDEVQIINNAYNPTVQDIIDGNCSL